MLRVSMRVISNPDGLLEIEDRWNTFVGKCSRNPFCLSSFVQQFMEFYHSRGWTPLVLVISADNIIVGTAPLITKKKFGIRFIRFVGYSWFQRDFVVDDQYRDVCIVHILDFLFKTLRCQFADLVLPAESPNLPILKKKCKAKKICLYTKPAFGHCIIPIKCTWDEFKASRGSNFRRRFKRIERRLSRAGSWRVTCVESGDGGSGVFERILDVERRSWKEAWRSQRRMEIDPDLPMIWKAAQYTARANPDFNWTVWFLELNDQTIAYSLVLQYKKVAFIIKTSYDNRYKRSFPGIYVNNATVRELFNKRQVRTIDWISDLPFHRNWTSTCIPRIRVLMSRKGVSTIILHASPELLEFLDMTNTPQLKPTAELLLTQLSCKMSSALKRLQGTS